MKNKAVEYLDKLDEEIEELIEASIPDGIDVGVSKRRGINSRITITIEAEEKEIIK